MTKEMYFNSGGVVTVESSLFHEIREKANRADMLESLLQDCMSTMDNCHAYDTDSYRAAQEFLYGGEEE